MLRHLPAAIVAAAVALFAVGSPAQADLFIYGATLSRLDESPPNASPATGLATVTIDTTAQTMRVVVSFSGLIGTTIAAHIHASTANPLSGTAGVATTVPTFSGFPTGVTSGFYDNTLDLTLLSTYNPAFVTANGNTVAGAEAALLSGIAAQKAYFNLHTTAFPGGEIRGFLIAVPEPASLTLLSLGGIGLIGLGLARRRRSA